MLKPDAFLLDSGLLSAAGDAAPTDAQMEVLLQEAEMFLRSGTSWEFWKGLSPLSKAVFVEAAERIARNRIVLMAQALRGPEGVAEVLRPVDGGDMKIRRALQSVVQETASGVTAQLQESGA